MVNVTKSYLPQQELYQSYLSKIWENRWLTNHGPLEKLLCDKLKEYLNVPNLILTSNGTLSLQVALKFLLDKPSEIITTPFSYIASSSSLVWEGHKPVFVDIDPNHLTIDADQIEQSISADTKAILATHVFGNPCDVNAIEALAKKYDIKVIYDASHCFGVTFEGQSIFKWGDLSTTSFHATKLFHTCEGGGIFFKDSAWRNQLVALGNFGHHGQYDYAGVGVNSKMSEIHAAMGLAMLPDMSTIFAGRKRVVNLYNQLLDWGNPGLTKMKIRLGTEWNYSYYPVIFPSEEVLEEVLANLSELQIYPRRYFYPSLNTIDYLKGQKMPISEDISKRVLCLPLYHDLDSVVVEKISSIINMCIVKSPIYQA
ncbi:MAG: DegT/DnrJ/EryC1/StrS family aminotransferase [Marinoscillum sp.]|jgi:dTDP-4-amino-4,6-dideoxygalactose transaminase